MSELKKTKILYLIKTMDVGGAERFTLNLARYIAAGGAEVTVASTGGIFVEGLLKNGIKHIGLKNRPEINNIIPLTIELLRIIREDNYTIIHCQHRIFTFILQFIYNRKFILFYTAHNVFNDLFQKIIFPDMTVAVSQTIKLNLLSTSYIPENKIKLINNGVDTPDNKRTANNLLTMGFLGRLISVKGIFNLLKAVAILSQDKTNFRLIIRGKGETEEIIKFINLNKLNSMVTLAGVSDNEETIYHGIDILVLPTKMNEGLPISILEAAARGILVVSTNAGGIGDFIEDEITGIILKSTEPDELAKVLKEIICNYDNFTGIIKNAHTKIKKDFSLDQMTSKYKKLYNESLLSVS
jgi:glycosyltransferase involved in cell wall biosynthesis